MTWRFALVVVVALVLAQGTSAQVFPIPGPGRAVFGGGVGAGPFTYVGTAYGNADGPTDTVTTGSSIDIEDGDLIITATQWEDDATTALTDVRDQSDLNIMTEVAGDDVHNAGEEVNLHLAYSTAATGKTGALFTATAGANVGYIKLTVIVFRPSGGTISRDISGTREAVDDTNSSNSIVTGTFSTTGLYGIVCGVAGIYTSGSWSAQQVAGVTADNAAANNGQTIWCDRDPGPLTTQTATSTYSFPRYWVATVIAFKAE